MSTYPPKYSHNDLDENERPITELWDIASNKHFFGEEYGLPDLCYGEWS